jgi:hypothetical protein
MVRLAMTAWCLLLVAAVEFARELRYSLFSWFGQYRTTLISVYYQCA